jgi:ABC-2 type transport system ATP-binding protein
MDIVSTYGLTKYYGDICAVEDLTLAIRRGEVFCLLGPNGAGKTTTIRMLTTLIRPSKGTANICGYDIIEEPKKVREKISCLQQQIAVDLDLTIEEELWIFGRLHSPIPKGELKNRINTILKELSLTEYRQTPIKHLSLGLRRRAQLATALVRDAEVYFLDEPTVGLDPEGFRAVWSKLKTLVKDGKTIFLTTHNMNEAEEVADRIGMLRRGRIIELSSPQQIIRKIGEYVVVVETSKPIDKKLYVEYSFSKNNYYLFGCKSKDDAFNLKDQILKLNPKAPVKIRRSNIGDAFLLLTNEPLK